MNRRMGMCGAIVVILGAGCVLFFLLKGDNNNDAQVIQEHQENSAHVLVDQGVTAPTRTSEEVVQLHQEIRAFQQTHENNTRLNQREHKLARAYLQFTGIDALDVNQTLNILVAQQPPPQDLFKQLIALYKNTNYSPRVRDYAVQFLYDAGTFATANDQKLILTTLQEIAQSGTEKMRGTALRSWGKLLAGQHVDTHTTTALTALVVTVLNDVSLPLHIRTAALSTVADVHIEEAHESVLKIIDGSLDSSGKLLRIALSALGYIGTAHDIALLNIYEQHDNQLVSAAARSSIARLRK